MKDIMPDSTFLPNSFHMPGIEPWIIAILNSHEMRIVLDVGVGTGFWGYLIRTYVCQSISDPYLIGIDIDVDKLKNLKKIKVYDDLVCSDIRNPPFRNQSFDTVLAFESLYFWDNFEEVLKTIEELVDKSLGLMLLSKGLDRNMKRKMLEDGYEMFSVYLRGLYLEKYDSGEPLSMSGEDEKKMKLFFPLLKLSYKFMKPNSKNYTIAFKFFY